MKLLLILLLASCITHFCHAQMRHVPEQGIFHFPVVSNTTHLISTSKILYNESNINIKVVHTDSCTYQKPLYLKWIIIGTKCKGQISNSNANLDYFLRSCLNDPLNCAPENMIAYVRNYNDDVEGAQIDCKTPVQLSKVTKWTTVNSKDMKTSDAIKPAPDSPKKTDDQQPDSDETGKSNRKRRAAVKQSQTNQTDSSTPKKGLTGSEKHSVATVPFLGEYTVIIFISNQDKEHVIDKGINFEVTVEMKGPLGYLSAHEYPLLNFYMVMCIVYVLFAVSWLVLSACNYHDLLRVQFWIGGVILLGMIEKAVHYSEFLTVNTTGISGMGIEKFAEIVSAFKRAVARMLVIIVSLGFGIVKPRLGPMLHRVLLAGLVYFILAVIEAMARIDQYFTSNTSQAWMLAYLPLTITDALICWWIFLNLVQTMKTLRLRRNTTKLALYRHFSNTIIFCVIASIGIIIWTYYVNNEKCDDDLSSAWLEIACWPILFSVILMVIMFLWRPNANNQRYAYSPMIDGNDSDLDEMEEPMLGGGPPESLKMRNAKKPVIKPNNDKTEEDLKWIEENIPQTVADAALPAILDSDEEAVATKYEMSKME